MVATMSQIFYLKLATDNLLADAKALGVTTEHLQSIVVKVTISIAEAQLLLDYEISLPILSLTEQLQWPSWQTDKVAFSDYLWQQTCLECFITDNKSSYIEINANPDGRYALYYFDDYRSPSALPPSPLLKSSSKNRANIYWKVSDCDNGIQKDSTYFKRSFAICLAQLPFDLLDADYQTLINPCIILYFNDTALYFATNHASPADFHQRRYWTDFKL